MNDYQLMQCEFPNEDIMALFDEGELLEKKWTMLFDGASNILEHEIGAILISPKKAIHPNHSYVMF